MASPITIQDSYIGGGTTHHSWQGEDVIGDPNSFDISSMDIALEGSLLTVSIYSTYFKNVGALDTVLGDLLISTDGYTPFGTAGFSNDTHENGEDWELAVTLDNHGGEISNPDGIQNFLGEGGIASLYAVNDSNIILTDVPQGIFRAEQETQYDGTQQAALTQGSWNIFDVAGSDYDSLTFVIDLGAYAPSAGQTLGFHWNMTCGNDTIEGAYQVPNSEVPEPGTALLLGLGALCARRRYKK